MTELHTIFTDVYTTRRQRMHHVEGPDGHLLWSGRQFVEALEYILDHDIQEFRVEAQDWSYIMTARRDSTSTTTKEKD